MANEDGGRPMVLFEKPGGGKQVVDVARKAGVAEFALALAKAREVESQHGKAGLGERPADVRCGLEVLRTGETVGKQGVSSRLRERAVQGTGQGLTGAVPKIDADFQGLAFSEMGKYLAVLLLI